MDRRKLLGPKIKALSTALEQDMNRNTAALGLTCSQSFFLSYLIHNRDRAVYSRDLEREFDFAHPTVSGVLRRLELKGFISFQPGEKDKRCKQILVTGKAIECHAMMVRHLHETEDKVTAGMTPQEIQDLHRLLGIAMRNMGVSLSQKPLPEQEDRT